MGRIRAVWLMGVVLLAGEPSLQAGPTRVSGRVVRADGVPVAGAVVGSVWYFDDGKMEPFPSSTTDADGWFRCEPDFFGQVTAFMAVDAGCHEGGVVTIDPAHAADPIVIKLGPLVRVHGRFESRELGRKPSWTNATTWLAAGKVRLAHCRSTDATFDLKLPPGSYLFSGNGMEEVERVSRPLELRPDQPDVDLGTIDLPASPLGRMLGKEPIPLHVTAARGISQDVKLSDFRGKWVILDFWGYWCGACVAESLPNLIEIWDEHPDDRDKFVVLAIHDPQAENFAQLDAKLKPIVEKTWGGRELPFPILLDATGQTVADYGIRSWPTTIAINPEGIIVEGGAAALKRALPAVPAARRMRTVLDRPLSFGLSTQPRLNNLVRFLARELDLPIELDLPALGAAGVAPDTIIPLAMNAQVSLRSWFNLTLGPLGLGAVPGPEGFTVTTVPPGAPTEPSTVQLKVAQRINAKLGEPTSFDFTDRTLADVASFCEQQTGETFVLDPADRLAGRLDPKTTVTGRASGVPLRAALKDLLGPLGIEAVVRDEVVVLSKPAPH